MDFAEDILLFLDYSNAFVAFGFHIDDQSGELAHTFSCGSEPLQFFVVELKAVAVWASPAMAPAFRAPVRPFSTTTTSDSTRRPPCQRKDKSISASRPLRAIMPLLF
ncbi:hypothetical protein [Actinomadura nitritigenes]|uniref:hypothetical protein n=1 Tax=Actinomadura nitritigenes TaxID=134602 RepID=UPI003D8FF75D